jgi:hypothetical protein
MLQAFELTDDKRFLDEARAAIDAAMGLRFNVNYQANLTAWGAAACMRLWRITNEGIYLEQSYVYLASFFHNSEIWESEIGARGHYQNFLGVTCSRTRPIWRSTNASTALQRSSAISTIAAPISSRPCAHAGRRILQICAWPCLVLLSRRAAARGDLSRAARATAHRSRTLLPARGSLCRRSEIYGAGAAFGQVGPGNLSAPDRRASFQFARRRLP